MLVSAQDLLRTRDCAFGSCINEAENGSEFCVRHGVRIQAVPAVKTERRPGAERLAQGLCKVEGCPHKANERYDRGVYHGLCVEVHIPAAKKQASERSAAAHERRAGEPNKNSREAERLRAAASKPEPVVNPSPGDDGFEARAARLVEVGRRLDEARAELDVATSAFEAATLEWVSTLTGINPEA